jgi:RHS repeat-associated protein
MSFVLMGATGVSLAQTVVATVTVGTQPTAIGVNPTTNKIYVANHGSRNVSVIDGATNGVVATVTAGTYPTAIGVNPTTNKIYVANYGSKNVSVIDGATNGVVATVTVGTQPTAIGVNPTTNKVNVANHGSRNVSVIDGATNGVVATVTAGTYPTAIGVNPTTNKVYVANYGSRNVSILTNPLPTITASAGANGSISPSGEVSVIYGSDQSFTVTPAPHYRVADVLVDGHSVGAVTSYTFTNVTYHHSISATFTGIMHTISASAGTNGSISPSGVISILDGQDKSFTMTPASHYRVADVLVDGHSVGAVTSYTFTNVTSNHTISATFAVITHTITASAGPNGSISPSGVISILDGQDKSFTMTPASPYKVSGVLVDGSSVGAVTSYTFNNVTSDHTIAASFALEDIPPEVEISSPIAGQYVKGTVSIVGSASDEYFKEVAVAVASGDNPKSSAFRTIRVNTVPVQGMELASWDSTQFGDGDFTIKATATDLAGNSKDASVVVHADNTAPETCISSPRDSETVTGQVTLRGIAADRYLSSYVVQYAQGDNPGPTAWVDLGPPQSSSVNGGILAVWNTEGLADDPYSLLVVATDVVGQSTTASIHVDVMGTSTAPIAINDGGAFTRRRAVRLTLNSSDAKYMQLKNEGSEFTGRWEPYATKHSWVLSDGDGEKTVSVEFKNAGGQVSSASDSIVLDTTPPKNVRITAPASHASLSVSTEVVAKVDSDTGSGLQGTQFYYSFGGTPIIGFGTDSTAGPPPDNEFNYSFDPTTIGYGYFDLFVRVYDRAGNCTLSNAVPVSHLSADETWLTPGYDTANIRYNSGFKASAQGVSSRWGRGSVRYDEEKTQPIAAIGDDGQGHQVQRIYQKTWGEYHAYGDTVGYYESVVGLDPANGAECFKYFKDGDTSYQRTTIPVSVSDGFLYVCERTKILRFKVGDDNADHKVVYEIGEEIKGAPSFPGGSVAIVPLQNKLLAVNLSDPNGAVESLWEIPISGPGTPAVVNQGATLQIVFIDGSSHLNCASASGHNAQIIWQNPDYPYYGTPTIVNNVVYVPAISYNPNNPYASPQGITARRLSDGTAVWNPALIIPEGGVNYLGRFAVAYNIIYAVQGGRDNPPVYLDARDATTGSLLWRKELRGLRYISPNTTVSPGAPAVGNGQVFVEVCQVNSVVTDRTLSSFNTLDAFSGAEMHEPFVVARANSWVTNDHGVTLAFGAIFVNLDSTTTICLDPLGATSQQKGFDNYCGFYDEVNTSLGAYTLKEEDIKVPTRGLPLEFTRNYSSYKIKDAYSFCQSYVPADGPLGPGWSYNYGMRLQISMGSDSSTVNLIDEEGSSCPYTFTGTSTSGKQPNGVFDKLDKIPGSPDRYVLTRKDHSQYEFLVVKEWDSGNSKLARLVSMCNDDTRTDTNKTTLVYDDSDPNQPLRLTQVVEPGGRSIQITYYGATDGQKNGKIKQVDGPAGIQLGFDYIYQGTYLKTSTFTDPNKKVTTYTYHVNDTDNKGLEDIQDPRGGHRQMGYQVETVSGGKLLRVVSKTDQLGYTTSLSYSTINRETIITDPEGRTTIHRSDSADRIIQEIDPEGGIVVYNYAPDGTGSMVRDRRGYPTSYQMKEDSNHKSTGDVASIYDPKGGIQRCEYNDNHMMTKSTDQNGHDTSFTYGTGGAHANDLTAKTDACGHTIQYEYGAEGYGKPTRVVDIQNSTPPKQRTTEYTYDAHGNVTKERKFLDNFGNAYIDTDYVYDDAGRVLQKTDPERNTYYYEYSKTGKLLLETGPPPHKNTYEYDESDNLITEKDSEGRITIHHYDPCDRPVKTDVTVNDIDKSPHDYTERTAYTRAGNIESKTDRNGNVTRYQFDGSGHTTCIIDPLGKPTYMNYDANGNNNLTDISGYGEQFSSYDELNRLVYTRFQSTEGETLLEARFSYDPVGNRTSESKILEDGVATTDYTYDACNRLLTKAEPPDKNGVRPITTTSYYDTGEVKDSVDPNGYTTHYEYDYVGRKKTEELNDGQVHLTTYDYDNNGNKLRVQDPDGHITRNEYDNLDRITAEYVDVGGGQEQRLHSYSYDRVGNRIGDLEGTGPEAQNTHTVFDELNRPIKQLDIYGNEAAGEYFSTTVYYDGVGNKLRVKNKRDYITSYTYDGLNRVITKEEPEVEPGTGARVSSYYYNDDFREVVVTDPKGAETVTHTDGLGRETCVQGPSGEQKITSYNRLSKPMRVETWWDGDQPSAEGYEYDLLGRLVKKTDPLGHVTTYGYDREGNLVTETDPEGNSKTYTYNGLGKVTSQAKNYDGPVDHVTTYAYDLVGNKTAETDGEGRTIEYVYDPQNRVIAAKADPSVLNLTTSYQYDSVGNLTQVTDPRNNQVLRMTYDNLGDMKSESDFAGHTYHYTYDPEGNLTRTEDPSGAVTNRAYNAANLIYGLDAPGTEDDITYHYDKSLNYQSVSNHSSDHTLSFNYDASNRLSALTSNVTGEPALTYTQSFLYNLRDDMKSVTGPGFQTQYSYDAGGNLTRVQDSRAGQYQLSYHDDDALKTITYPGGVNITYNYYRNDLPKDILTKRPNNETISHFAYAYDRGDQPTSCQSFIDGNPASSTYTYQYDGAERLTASLSGFENLNYTYDASGNLTSKTRNSSTTTYTYNNGNQLASDSTGTNHAYDPCGNLTGIDTPAADTTYTYNALSQMTGATVGTTSVNYTYDPLGRMTESEKDGTTTCLAMLATHDDPIKITTDASSESYVRTPAGDRILGLIDPNGDPQAVGLDTHSDVVFTADEGGGVTSSSFYSPYGEETATTGTLDNPIGFQSDYTDPDTDLVDMGVRWYDPELSRFDTPDPANPQVTDPESYNPYLYADDCPLLRMDPEGKSWYNPFSWQVTKRAGRWLKKHVGEPVYEHVIRPVGHAVVSAGRTTYRGLVNSAKWTGKTTASVGRHVIKGLAYVGGLYNTIHDKVSEAWHNFLIGLTIGQTYIDTGKSLLGFAKGLPKGAWNTTKGLGIFAWKMNPVRAIINPRGWARDAHGYLVGLGGAIYNSPKNLKNWVKQATADPEKFGEMTGEGAGGLMTSAAIGYGASYLAEPLSAVSTATTVTVGEETTIVGTGTTTSISSTFYSEVKQMTLLPAVPGVSTVVKSFTTVSDIFGPVVDLDRALNEVGAR